MGLKIFRFGIAGFLLSVVSLVTAQDQSIADSLVKVYEAFSAGDTSRFRVLADIANNQTDPVKKLEYADLLVNEAEKTRNIQYLHHGYLNQGQAYRLLGDFDVAIYALLKALNYAEESDYLPGIAASNSALADVYSILGNHVNAVLYYKRAIQQLPERTILKATVLLNLGDEYYLSKMYDSALACFEKSRAIYEEQGNDRSGLAYNLGNIGLVYAELGELEKAGHSVAQSIHELEKLEDHYGIAIFLSYMAEIYQRKGLLESARVFADSSMAIAKRYGLKAEIRDNSLRLADIYARNSNYEAAYKYHQQYVEFKDSIANDEIYSRIENLESAFELAKKQAEVDLLTERQKNQQIIITTTVIIAVILTILAMVIFSYYRSKTKINKVLKEQKRSLESLNQTKDHFFSIISHDLRGPINSFHGISGMIKFFVQSKDTEQLLKVADDIDQSVDRLSGLLDNLLSWAMQQKGHFPNVPEKVDLKESVEEVVETMTNMAESKNITLTSDIERDIKLWVDRNTTMTIIRNLVNNSLKFTPPGGAVIILAVEVGDCAKIEVSDNGIGIPRDKLKMLFRLQDKKSTYGTAGEKGLGLGLQLVYEFVEMNGGTIEVSSTEKEGTTFTVKLPLFESVGVEA